MGGLILGLLEFAIGVVAGATVTSIFADHKHKVLRYRIEELEAELKFIQEVIIKTAESK